MGNHQILIWEIKSMQRNGAFIDGGCPDGGKIATSTTFLCYVAWYVKSKKFLKLKSSILNSFHTQQHTFS